MKKNQQHISSLSDHELINCYSSALKELKNRKIIRTKNVTGELGERIAVEHYCAKTSLPQLKLVPTSTQHIDAVCTKGRRYAIKTITGRTTGVFYGLPDPKSKKTPSKIFDYLIIVKLNENYEVQKIIEVEWNVFLCLKKWHTTMKAWNITVTKELISKCMTIFP